MKSATRAPGLKPASATTSAGLRSPSRATCSGGRVGSAMAFLMRAEVSAWANEPAAQAARMISTCTNPDISITPPMAELVRRRLIVKVGFKSSSEHGYVWNAHWRNSAANRPSPLRHPLLREGGTAATAGTPFKATALWPRRGRAPRADQARPEIGVLHRRDTRIHFGFHPADSPRGPLAGVG